MIGKSVLVSSGDVLNIYRKISKSKNSIHSICLQNVQYLMKEILELLQYVEAG